MNETFPGASWFDHVKRESHGDSCLSEAPQGGLYPEHEVKPELVVGPVLLQPQDVAYSILGQFGTPIKVEKDDFNRVRVSETQFHDEHSIRSLGAHFIQQVEQNSVKQEPEPKTRSGNEQFLGGARCLEAVEKNVVNHKQVSQGQCSNQKRFDAGDLAQVENEAAKSEVSQAQPFLVQSIDIEENSEKVEQGFQAKYCDQLPVNTRNLEQQKNIVKVEQDSQTQCSDEQSIVCIKRVEQDSVHQEQDICWIVDADVINQVEKDKVKQGIDRCFDDRVIKQLLTPCIVQVYRLPDLKANPCFLSQNLSLITHTEVHDEENMSPEIKDLPNEIKKYFLEIRGEPIESEINDRSLTMSNEKRTNNAVSVNNKVAVKRKKKYHCETCGEKFTAKSKLKTHSRKHREKKPKIERRKSVIEKKYKCNICGRWSDEKSKLIAHIQIHMGFKPHVCGICGRQYNSLARLERHERTHTGVKPYICDICEKRYSCKYSLSRHLMRHMGVTLYNCKICNKGFINRSHMMKHELVHTGIKSLSCEICEKQFSRRGALNAHILTHTNGREIICEICGKTMSALKSLKKHKLIHAGVKPHPCKFCKKKYRTEYAMRLHTKRVHTKANSRSCMGPIDLLGNPNLSVIKEHDEKILEISQSKENQLENSSKIEIPHKMPLVENSASNNEKQVSLQNLFESIKGLETRDVVENLPPCSSNSNKTQLALETFPVFTEEASDLSKSESQVQIETVTVQSERNAFDIPEVTTISQEPIEESRNETDINDTNEATIKIELTVEMLVNEEKKKPYTCDTCGKRYAEKNQLIPHFRVHTGEFRCEFCSKTFPYACFLSKHKQTHMEKPMRYSCDVCKMKFKSVRSLEAHSRVHTGEKLHPCKLCTKQFNASYKLKIHMRTHTGEKPYFCDICDKRFGQHGNLARHKRTHAAQNKPYSCDICEKRFVTLAYAAIHKKIHTGEKPYTCEICSKQFLHSVSYNNHKKLHVGPKEKKHTCKICNAKFANPGHLRRHQQIHTGVKPFSCDLCGKRFYNRSHLHRHTKNQKRPCVD